MSKVKILKSRILDYLHYSPKEVDPIKLAYFLEGNAENSFYIIEGKKPSIDLLAKLKGRKR